MSHKKDLLERIVVNGLSLIFLILLISYANRPVFRLLFSAAVAIIQAIALWEYFQIVKRKNLKPAIVLGLIASVFYVFANFFKTQSTAWQAGPEIILALTFFACFVFYAIVQEEPLLNISATFLGIIYVTIPLALIVRIVYFFVDPSSCEGCFWLVYLIAVTKAADTGAFFVGRAFGKIKLASKLSPNKTLEGALGGLIAAIVVSFITYEIGIAFGYFDKFLIWQSLGLGIAIGIFGQLGDLAESLLKRDAQVKDSNKIPGVGGILDMVDSLLFTSPIIFIFLKLTHL